MLSTAGEKAGGWQWKQPNMRAEPRVREEEGNSSLRQGSQEHLAGVEVAYGPGEGELEWVNWTGC